MASRFRSPRRLSIRTNPRYLYRLLSGPDRTSAVLQGPLMGTRVPSGTAVSSRRCSRAPAPDDDDVDALDIPTICRRSKTGRSYVYEEIRAGRLIARKFGRLTRVLQRDY